MSSINDPMETASTHASPPATDHDIGVGVDPANNEDASSEVSRGGNLRDDLEGVLKGDFDFKGKFALSRTFVSTPLPGLHIRGIGVIGFPLSEHDAKLIESAATQAPFGKGTETVVDTAVRDTFEINPNNFSFENPAWSEFLRSVTKDVANGLGLPPNSPPPRAELYKLLLYKTGSHFLPHKDTEKSQGMFASLIIVLPSKFEGGEVHVSHGSDKDVFNISPSSGFATSVLAWYTDVTHEVKPVTSGYRLAISYNLVNALLGLPPPHLPDIHSAVSAVEGIFRKWKKGGYNNPGFSGTIAYLLNHQYSKASLQFGALKGKDATLVSNIRGVAEKQGVCLRLGLLECEVSGDAEERDSDYDERFEPFPEMYYVQEKVYRIEGLYDLDGDLAKGRDSITLDPEFDMIPRDPGFDNETPDDRDFEGYTGNDGAPMTYWYRRSVLVMSLAGKGLKSPLHIGGVDYAFKKLQRWKAEGPTDRNKKMAQFLISHGSSNHRWLGPSSRHPQFLIDLALEWDDVAMWQEVLKKSRGQIQLSLDMLIRAWTVFTFDQIKNIIEMVIHDQHTTKAAVDLITTFQARAPAQDPDVKTWLKQQTTAAFSSIRPQPSVQDVQMFVGIAKSEGLPFFSNIILKQLVGFGRMFDFWVDLAEGLWKNRDKLLPSGGTPEDASAYITALNHILDGLIVASIPEYNPSAVYYRPHPSTRTPTGPGDHTRILKLLDLMVITRRTQNLGQLIVPVSQPQGDLSVKYQTNVIPLIPKLKARYQQYDSSQFPVLDAFLRAFVERWLQDLLGTPSKRPDGLVEKLACECQDCAKVNQFLRSDAVTETFWAAQKRRSHMEANLRRTRPDAVFLDTTMERSPYGLKVTKNPGTLATGGWDSRVESARAFLALVGTPDPLARIMGDRYQDVQAALAGTKAYKIGKSIPITVPLEDAPPVASTSTVPVTASGTQTGPVVAGVKRKAEDEGDVIDLTSD